MNPNLLILIIGAVDVIMGVSIFLMADTITSQAFIPSLINDESIIIGTLMHEAMASQIIAIGIIFAILRSTKEIKSTITHRHTIIPFSKSYSSRPASA